MQLPPLSLSQAFPSPPTPQTETPHYSVFTTYTITSVLVLGNRPLSPAHIHGETLTQGENTRTVGIPGGHPRGCLPWKLCDVRWAAYPPWASVPCFVEQGWYLPRRTMLISKGNTNRLPMWDKVHALSHNVWLLWIPDGAFLHSLLILRDGSVTVTTLDPWQYKQVENRSRDRTTEIQNTIPKYS